MTRTTTPTTRKTRPTTPALAAAAGLLAATLLAASGVGGCGAPAAQLTPEQRAAGVQPVPMQPAWRSFATDNFRGVVMAELRAQPDAQFTSDPDISAARRLDGGGLELTAIGDVDVNNARGDRLRKTYYVVWRQQGGGWDSGTARINAGKPTADLTSRPPATGPVVAPATRPVTPADPTAPSPGPATPVPGVPGAPPPLPPADGGGTPALPPSGGSGSPSLPPGT